MDTDIINLVYVAGSLLAALGVFMILAAFCKKGCGWIFFGCIALIVSVVFGAGCLAVYAVYWIIGAIIGAMIFAVVRYIEEAR